MDKSKDLSSFSYICSYSLCENIKIKIVSLQGNQLKPQYESVLENPLLKFSGLYQSPCADLMVQCQVYNDGLPLCLPVSSSYKSFTTRWNWNEWITLPVMYSDLPRNAKLAITIYDCVGPSAMKAVGGTTISLFGKHGSFRKGMIDLRVWPFKEADPGPQNSTPGKSSDPEEQMHTLSKLTKQYRNGEMKTVEWMDRLTFREIETINDTEKKSSDYMYLMIELQDLEKDIVYYEQECYDLLPSRMCADIVTIPDSEIGLDNLVEAKHHKLARSLRSGVSDKDAKPNAKVRDTLNAIVNYPPNKPMTAEEQDLIWQFRFYLRNQKKASVKFLECVNWKVAGEARQALDLLGQWAPMDVEDALRLLSPSFQHSSVRRYAVARLQQASDEDLLLYLLQLVQALKYENFDDICAKHQRFSEFIISKEASNMVLVDGAPAPESAATTPLPAGSPPNPDWVSYLKVLEGVDIDLAMFLIVRACRNFNLANYLHWYLTVECEDHKTPAKQDSPTKNRYQLVISMFMLALQYGDAEAQKMYAFLKDQKVFIDKLVLLVKSVACENANRKKKIELLQSLLKDQDAFKFNFAHFDPLPLPLDPNVRIIGVVPEKAILFKSALMPSKLTFVTSKYQEYVTIFKHGDDLRQDQLVLQIITLMDKLLRKESLDLKLTPYRVLAVSIKHGFVQFVESVPVAEVLGTEGTILNFFRKHHPCEGADLGVAADVMDTYVKSCAGYCVITYLLGVGDRHFDNLLLTTSGKLFHIDFGYILGRDPKPLPPPMKLSKEMVDGMGGANSPHYQTFRKLCYTAFLHLRRHSNLILNLFNLMTDANVPDIALEPDKAVIKVQEKFKLEMGDEEAVRHLQSLLDTSVSAMFPAMVEQFHKFAQYWRK